MYYGTERKATPGRDVVAVPVLQENAHVIIARAVHRDHVTRPVAACATRAAKRDNEVERSEAEGSPSQPLLVPTNRIFDPRHHRSTRHHHPDKVRLGPVAAPGAGGAWLGASLANLGRVCREPGVSASPANTRAAEPLGLVAGGGLS